jgi:hypothetical protein
MYEKIQQEILDKTEPLRRTDYAIGRLLYGRVSDDVEGVFYKRFLEEHLSFDRIYLPIYWLRIRTAVDLEINKQLLVILKDFLSSLDPTLPYFTVAFMRPDDSLACLPNVHAYAGGGQLFGVNACSKYIPLPLYVPLEQAPDLSKNRSLFAGFYGNMKTHIFRKVIEKELGMLPGFTVTERISRLEYQTQLEQTLFSLCPRGAGPTSIRMYESMVSGAIPVYISDQFYLPYRDQFDWDNLCLRVHFNELHDLPRMLRSFSSERLLRMRNCIEQFLPQLELSVICDNIIRMLKQGY